MNTKLIADSISVCRNRSLVETQSILNRLNDIWLRLPHGLLERSTGELEQTYPDKSADVSRRLIHTFITDINKKAPHALPWHQFSVAEHSREVTRHYQAFVSGTGILMA